MEFLCPLCNGLNPLESLCPSCGSALQDQGPLQDYLGPYSPYREKGEVLQGDIQGVCLHLILCPHCQWDTRLAVTRELH